jgi:hypothetical protein
MVSCIPVSQYLTCPRCKFPRSLESISQGGTGFACSGCEWYFTLATPAVTTPAVPATTVTAANTAGTPVAVTFTGGTVTAITVNGTVTGQTTGIVIVPVAGTVSWTGTVAPTWAWALPLTSGALTLVSTALAFTHWGTAFAAGQFLMVDTGANADIVQVNGTPADTSVPVTGLSKTHGSGVAVGICVPTATYSSVEAVPQNAY